MYRGILNRLAFNPILRRFICGQVVAQRHIVAYQPFLRPRQIHLNIDTFKPIQPSRLLSTKRFVTNPITIKHNQEPTRPKIQTDYAVAKDPHPYTLLHADEAFVLTNEMWQY